MLAFLPDVNRKQLILYFSSLKTEQESSDEMIRFAKSSQESSPHCLHKSPIATAQQDRTSLRNARTQCY